MIHWCVSGKSSHEVVNISLQFKYNCCSSCSVGISLGLLAGSKLLTVCVPFLFKGAIDTMTTLNMDTAPDAVLSTATAMLLGCKSGLDLAYLNLI